MSIEKIHLLHVFMEVGDDFRGVSFLVVIWTIGIVRFALLSNSHADAFRSANSTSSIGAICSLARTSTSSEGSDLDLKIQREEQILYFNVPLSVRKNVDGDEEKYIGIIPGFKRSFLDSLSKGTYETYNLSIKTLTFVGKMITRDLGTQNLILSLIHI